MRGLVERALNPKDQRSFLYRPTIGLLGHLGVRSVKELPEFEAVTAELQSFVETQSQTYEDTEHD